MTRHKLLMATCLLAVLPVRAVGAEPLPEPVAAGSRIGHSLCEKYLSGPHAGTARSLICDLAGRPAVLVYAREVDPTLIRLLGKLDAVAGRGQEQKMTSSCVLLTSTEEDEKSLQALATREDLGTTILAATPLQWERPYFGNSPGRRNLHKDAAVTVIVLQRLTVQASFAFRAGELNDKSVAEIVKAASALVPPVGR
jgi:hypothetical protein